MRCQSCGAENVQGASFCAQCGRQLEAIPSMAQSVAPLAQPNQYPPMPAQAVPQPQSSIWYQNFYRIRKKVLAIANQYWIEDRQGNVLGYTRQKILALKENIRVFTDDSMTTELFRIQQEQILDIWGTFAVIDSATNICVGKLKRSISSIIVEDEWPILAPNGQQIGRIIEKTDRGLIRKFVPGGSLIPEHVYVEFYGRTVAEIQQQFKIIGDIWEVDCTYVPQEFDRRTLLACMIMMGMIERERK